LQSIKQRIPIAPKNSNYSKEFQFDYTQSVYSKFYKRVMVRIETYELAFVYWKRYYDQNIKISIPSGQTKSGLNQLLGNVSIEEFREVDRWVNAPIKITGYLREYTPAELKTMLEIRFKTSFPFSLSMLASGDAHKLILGWFWYVFGLTDGEISRLSGPRTFNSDQERIFSEIRTADTGETKIVVVNAGPGTGKTTTANSLAIQNINDGVLLISYTNESINENYRRLREHPGTHGKVGKKAWDKLLNVVTADSLAARINSLATEVDHDKVIRLAISNINIDKFYHPIQGTQYLHVIVDECQDIDNLRGELILKFCKTVGAKTLTLFGDPRQRIRQNCGEWYSDLWTLSAASVNNGTTNVVQAPLSFSYRFSNPYVLDIVNKLSLRRPELHVTLKPYTDDERLQSDARRSNLLAPIEDSHKIRTVTSLDFLIKEILESGQFGEWAFIGPTVDRNNKTAVTAHLMATLLRSNGIRCYFRSDGAYVADAVAFLTIHSAKGREFNNVVLFGMNNYPKSFAMIPYSEAESLIYVAHSRARRNIFYILPADGWNDEFILPRGVEESDVDHDSEFGVAKVANQQSNSVEELFNATLEENHPHFSVSELIDDHSFVKFMTTNRMIPTISETVEIPDWEKPVRPDYISSALWGILLGIRFQAILQPSSLRSLFKNLLNGNYIVKSPQQIVTDKAKGNVIFGRDRVSGQMILDVQPDVITLRQLSRICSLDVETVSIDEWEFIAKCYARYMCGNYDENPILIERNSEYRLPTYRSDFIELIGGGEVEKQVSMTKYFHGQIDYICPEGDVYEFKTCGRGGTSSARSILQTWLYFVMTYAGTNFGDKDKSAYLVSLTEGKIYSITSNRSVESWKYVMKCFHLLWYHNTLVQQRKTYLIDNKRYNPVNTDVIPSKSYTIDTEFYMATEEIFEIAAVNVYDIFATFVETPRPKTQKALDFAIEWTGGLSRRCFETASVNLPVRFKAVESTTSPEVAPTFYHYLAGVDVKWYSKNYKLNVVDLGPRARIEASKYGVFASGFQPPQLGELYTMLSLVPLESQGHLKAHGALTDALMLYELITLGLI